MPRISPSAIKNEASCRYRAARARSGEPATDTSSSDEAQSGLVAHRAIAERVGTYIRTADLAVPHDLASQHLDPASAFDAVLRLGVAPAVLEDAAPLVAAALRTIRDLAVMPLDVEHPLEVDVGDGIVVAGFADMIATGHGRNSNEVWDWKTTATVPPSGEELENDVQVATYLAWLHGAYPDAGAWVARWVYLRHGPRVVTVRWRPGMETWLVAEARRAVRARALPPEKSPATPGTHCRWCHYRSSCAPLDAWLGRSTAPGGLDGKPIAELAAAYDDWRAVEKVADQRKRDAGERLDVLLGDERRFADATSGTMVLRVDQRRETWSRAVVRDLAAARGVDVGEMWARVGSVDAARVDAEACALTPEGRAALAEYRETRTSSYLRVSVK